MHPKPVELREYANTAPEARGRHSEITHHVAACAPCREYVELIVQWNIAAMSLAEGNLGGEEQALAERLYLAASEASARGLPRIVNLERLHFDAEPLPVRMAADGQAADMGTGGLEHFATLYAEDPELVLRVMRDRATGEGSLHLIGNDPRLTTNVMIHIVEPSLDFLTDAAGVAHLGSHRLDDPESLHWQVRLPDAVFALSPLEYDPEKPVASREFDLESDKDNRIHVALESRTEGVMMHINLVKIGGRDDIQRVRLVVSQGDAETQTLESRGHQPCSIAGLSASQPIDIRVFAD